MLNDLRQLSVYITTYVNMPILNESVSWCYHKRIYKGSLIIQNKEESTELILLSDTKTKVAYYQTKGKWALSINSNVNKLLTFPIVNADPPDMQKNLLNK